MESGVHVSLYSNCLHHIIYATIHLLTNVNYGTIRRLLIITSERQSNTFLETCHLKIQTLRNGILFNRPIKNILSNYILHEIIICDNQDPPWVYNRIKELINEKNEIFKNYLRSNMDPKSFNKFQYLQNELNFLSETIKKKKRITYLSRKKIMNPMTSSKRYWSILRSLLGDIANVYQKLDTNRLLVMIRTVYAC